MNIASSRPAIPADIKRRVLVEAGHRCAIPTCRYIEVELHHIIPFATCGTHEYENLIALCANCHRRADRGEIDRKALRIYKFNLRFAHDKYSQLEMDILFEFNKLPEGQGILWPPFNDLLLNRIFMAEMIAKIESSGGVWISGMQAAPSTLFLTQKGRQFLSDIAVDKSEE